MLTLRKYTTLYIGQAFFNTLKEFNLPIKLINLIEATMENSEIKIKLASSTSQSFKVTTGLRQGDVLSPIIFNLELEKVVRDMNISEGLNIRTVTDRPKILKIFIRNVLNFSYTGWPKVSALRNENKKHNL